MKKDRDYEGTLKGIEEMKAALELIQSGAKKLSNGVASAEASLKDEVGIRDCRSAREIADAIIKAASNGMQSVEMLESSVKSEKEEFDNL